MHSTVKDEKKRSHKRKIVAHMGEHLPPHVEHILDVPGLYLKPIGPVRPTKGEAMEAFFEATKGDPATPEESAAFLKACDTGKSDPAADLIRLNDLAAHVEELQTEIAQKDDEIARMKRETVSPETELLIREEIDRCAGLFADLQQALDKMASEKVATHLQNVRLRDKLSRVQPQLDTLAGKVVEKTHELKKVRRKSDRLKEALDVERDRVRTLTHHIDELEREVDANAIGPIFDQVHVQTLEKENARLRELVNESTPQRITQLENEIVQLREDENAALAENRKLHEQVEVGDRTLATLMNERDQLLEKIASLQTETGD